MADPLVCFVLFIHPDGKLSWKTTLPAPQLNLALDGVKADILAGRVQESKIAAPTNGDVQQINRVR